MSFTLIGSGWLATGILQGNAFLALFQPVVAFNGTPSVLELLMSMQLPVVGGVVLVMTNLDLLAALLSTGLRRVRRAAPISRVGLAYPLTFRFRTGVTVALLSLVVFLVLLLVTTNLGAIQEAQAATNSGGFQLQATVFGSQLAQDLNCMAQQVQALLDTRQELTLMEERQRVARDLHDSVKQHVFAISLLIGAAQSRLPGEPEAAQTYLVRAGDLTAILQQLRPAALVEEGLRTALDNYTRQWSQRTGIAAEFSAQGGYSIPLDIQEFEDISYAGGAQYSMLSEREVLRLIAAGFPNGEIARRLVIGEKTVKSHVSNILSKLQLMDRTQAAVFAWREGLVPHVPGHRGDASFKDK